jgi:hypothetical protein
VGKRLRIPLVLVAVHTSLLFLTAMAVLLSEDSHNADTTIGFAMTVFTLYIVDYPIGVLREAYRPCLPGYWLTLVFLYGVLGNAMWFLVGMIVQLVQPFLRSLVRSLSKWW